MGLFKSAVTLAKFASRDTALKSNETRKMSYAEKEQAFLQNFPFKYRCIIREKDSATVDFGLWEGLERGSYIIYDAWDRPVYIAKGTLLMGKKHFVITDQNRYEIGRINRALFNVPFPFMKERKTCNIEIVGQESFQIETYESFGEREFAVQYRDYSIKSDEREKEFKIFDRNIEKPIAQIYKVRSDERFFNSKYYVGFDQECDAVLASFVAIAIDLMVFSAE